MTIQCLGCHKIEMGGKWYKIYKDNIVVGKDIIYKLCTSCKLKIGFDNLAKHLNLLCIVEEITNANTSRDM